MTLRYYLSLPFWTIALTFYLLGIPFVIIARAINPSMEFP